MWPRRRSTLFHGETAFGSSAPPPPAPPAIPERVRRSIEQQLNKNNSNGNQAVSTVSSSSNLTPTRGPHSSPPWLRRQNSQSTVAGGGASSINTKRSNTSSVVSRVRSVVSRITASGRLGFGNMWKRGTSERDRRGASISETAAGTIHGGDVELDEKDEREWEQEMEILRRRRMASVGVVSPSPTPTLEESLKMLSGEPHSYTQLGPSGGLSPMKDVAGWVDSVPYAAAALEDAFGPDMTIVSNARMTSNGSLKSNLHSNTSSAEPSEPMHIDANKTQNQPRNQNKSARRQFRPTFADRALRPLTFLSNLSLTRSHPDNQHQPPQTSMKPAESPSSTPPRSFGADSALHLQSFSASDSRPNSVVLTNTSAAIVIADSGHGRELSCGGGTAPLRERGVVPDFGDVLSRVGGWAAESEQLLEDDINDDGDDEQRERGGLGYDVGLPREVFTRSTVAVGEEDDETSALIVSSEDGPGVPMMRRHKHIPIWTAQDDGLINYQDRSNTDPIEDVCASPIADVGQTNDKDPSSSDSTSVFMGRFNVAITRNGPSASSSSPQMTRQVRARLPPPIITGWSMGY